MNATNVRQNVIRSKFISKKFMQNIKINFSEQFDIKTGEIKTKQLQATLYVPAGDESMWVPAACLTIKMGNQTLFLGGNDVDELEQIVIQLHEFLIKNKTKCNDEVAKQRKAYFNHQREVEKALNIEQKNEIPLNDKPCVSGHVTIKDRGVTFGEFVRAKKDAKTAPKTNDLPPPRTTTP